MRNSCRAAVSAEVWSAAFVVARLSGLVLPRPLVWYNPWDSQEKQASARILSALGRFRQTQQHDEGCIYRDAG
ncbi:MAG: hypothetical protein FWD57_12320 [Polyangiaceae bacterium]|nr:hypothetical protein [Polyangiaceae bacterium]